MIGILLAAAIFAAVARIGLLAANFACAGVEPEPDGPVPSSVPARTIVVACAVLGAVAASRGLPFAAMAIVALACGLLAAIWASDVSRGIIPDLFTLVPLGALLLAAGLAGRWEAALAALIPAIPFAVLAWRSGGLGVGWGDVKLAALGGPLLGMQQALLAFAVGCLAAVIVARMRGVRNQPIAFAPYLASAIAIPFAVMTPGFH